MENLYFKIFDKYGAALAANLYPTQIQVLQGALEIYADSGEIKHIEDSFTRLAFTMILCDLIFEKKKKGKKR